MRRGQRPSRHIRRVWTKHGRRARLINPSIHRRKMIRSPFRPKSRLKTAKVQSSPYSSSAFVILGGSKSFPQTLPKDLRDMTPDEIREELRRLDGVSSISPKDPKAQARLTGSVQARYLLDQSRHRVLTTSEAQHVQGYQQYRQRLNRELEAKAWQDTRPLNKQHQAPKRAPARLFGAEDPEKIRLKRAENQRESAIEDLNRLELDLQQELKRAQAAEIQQDMEDEGPSAPTKKAKAPAFDKSDIPAFVTLDLLRQVKQLRTLPTAGDRNALAQKLIKSIERSFIPTYDKEILLADLHTSLAKPTPAPAPLFIREEKTPFTTEELLPHAEADKEWQKAMDKAANDPYDKDLKIPARPLIPFPRVGTQEELDAFAAAGLGVPSVVVKPSEIKQTFKRVTPKIDTSDTSWIAHPDRAESSPAIQELKRERNIQTALERWF